MKGKNFDCFWCDDWCIEKNEAWFVPGDFNALFYCNLLTKKTELLEALPNLQPNGSRVNPRCLKCNNDIYCMPDHGDSIWVYQLDKSEFHEIQIENKQGVRLLIVDFWLCDGKIYAVSVGLKQIIEISIKDRSVQGYYGLCEDTDASIGRSIIVGTKIYSVSTMSSRIYQFDTETKETKEFILPRIETGLYTIDFDGEVFWLSGCHKAIYIWNMEKNIVRVLDKFPRPFGVYDVQRNEKVSFDMKSVVYEQATFIYSIVEGQTVWFIPYMSTEILYVDRNTYEINILNIEQEMETEESLLRHDRRMPQKYFFEYIREKRYIGLYSLKNMRYLEIDTLQKKISYKSYFLSGTSKGKVVELYHSKQIENGIYNEKNYIDRNIFQLSISPGESGIEKDMYSKNKDIGLKIYHCLI